MTPNSTISNIFFQITKKKINHNITEYIYIYIYIPYFCWQYRNNKQQNKPQTVPEMFTVTAS